MRRFLGSFLAPFLLLAIPLGVLAGLGFVAAHRQLVRTRDAAVVRTVDAVNTLVADYQESLRRETVLLASDPAVVEGAVKGDWAILARGASPRVLAVTRDGLADFITIRDGRGTPLVQVPAGPSPSLPGTPAVTEPVLTLRLAGGQPYFLVTAPVQAPSGREPSGGPGIVVAGRRLDGLGAVLDRLPARPAVVFIAGDRALATSRGDLPASGWARAATLGAIDVGDEPFAVRRLAEPVVTSPDGGLWVVLSVREFARAERRLLLEFVALLGAGIVVLAGVVLAFLPAGRPRRPAGSGPADNPRLSLERRNRELEALNAVFATMSRGSDLATTAGETLEVVRGLARMDVGLVYRLDDEDNQLILEGQSGVDPRYLDRSRNRPVEGSHMGDAARTGQIIVTHLEASPPSDAGIREMAAERAHRIQLALPIPVEHRTWGVMVLVSKEDRDFAPEELATFSAVAHQVGLAVERAQLRDMAAQRLNRLEAQRVIERHISERLDTEELLVVIARSVQRLVGGTFSALYLLEGDTLRPRAWSDVPDWIRDLRFKVGAGVAGAALAAGSRRPRQRLSELARRDGRIHPVHQPAAGRAPHGGRPAPGGDDGGAGARRASVHRGGSLHPDRLRHAGRGGARERAALRRGHPQRGAVPGPPRGERRGQLDPRRGPGPRSGPATVPGDPRGGRGRRDADQPGNRGGGLRARPRPVERVHVVLPHPAGRGDHRSRDPGARPGLE